MPGGYDLIVRINHDHIYQSTIVGVDFREYDGETLSAAIIYTHANASSLSFAPAYCELAQNDYVYINNMGDDVASITLNVDGTADITIKVNDEEVFNSATWTYDSDTQTYSFSRGGGPQ